MLGIEVVFIIILCILCYIWLTKNLNYWKVRNVPFEKPLPIFGNIFDVVRMKRNVSVTMGDLYFKFSSDRFFGAWIFMEPHLVLRCPELIKDVLIRDFDYFNDRNVQSNEKVDPLTANMMFFVKNPKWKLIRTATTPMFTSGRLKYIFPEIQSIAKGMVAFVNDRSDRVFALKDLSVKYATDVICSIAFGIDSHSFQDNDTPFTDIGKGVLELTLRNATASATYFSQNPFVDFFKIKFIKTPIADFMTNIFLDMVRERQAGNSLRRDLVNVLIKFKEEYNLMDHEVVAQAAQFFLAGYETTSSTITFALYEISLNKQIQSKLRQEVSACIEDGEKFSYYTLKDNISYLHKVILETLRKYPTVPFLNRVCTKDYKIRGGDLIIEKGTGVMVPLLGIHNDPQYFPNPQKFDPERFSEENMAARNSFCYLPFGDGPRSCIGERIALISVKLALAHLIRTFEFETVEGTEVPLKFSANSFLLATVPIYVRVKKINYV